MTQVNGDQSATGIALQFVREEVQALRTAVHNELAATRVGHRYPLRGVAGLHGRAGPAYRRARTPLIDVEKDIVEIRAPKKDTKALWFTVAVAVLSAVLAWLSPLITATGKG
jgi:hypothetical protein